jgi:nudix-type nucleoside diphosphatase (YffH/AdpP family)
VPDLFLPQPLGGTTVLAALGLEQVEHRALSLSDHALLAEDVAEVPSLAPADGARADGLVLQGVPEPLLARLRFLLDVFGLELGLVETTAGHMLAPRATEIGMKTVIGPVWQDRWGALTVALVEDVLALIDERAAAEIAPRLGAMRVRAASRLAAKSSPAPTALRRRAAPGDIALRRRHQPYARFFSVEEFDLSHARFEGGPGPEINRAVFISGDAVTVLPYDPARDRLLLIEQFRAGPLARGDVQPWLLEAVAGRVDPGETPEDAARREAKEEAGISLGPLLRVAGYYPSPGAKSEYLWSYIALADLPDGTAGLHGLADEAEDIRGHLVSFDQAMDLARSGEVNNAPLLLSLLWLERERPRLRAGV